MFQVSQLKPIPRITRNLLARLEIACDNANFGCGAIMKLDMLQHHLKECEFNPKRPVPCDKGCDLNVPKDEMEAHNCVRELRLLIRSQEQKLSDCQTEVNDCKYQLAEQRREISLLKDLVRNLRLMPSATTGLVMTSSASTLAQASSSVSHASAASSSSPINAQSRTVTDQIQDDEVVRWASGLAPAKVTRWGGMIR